MYLCIQVWEHSHNQVNKYIMKVFNIHRLKITDNDLSLGLIDNEYYFNLKAENRREHVGVI